MTNDIDLHQPGGLQPYSPGTDLQPTHDSWGVEPDYASDRQVSSSGGQVQLFGQPLPPGATAEHVERVLGEISGIFMADMSRLGHSSRFSTAAVAWLQQTAMQPPRREQKQHSYDLHDQAGDLVAEAFGNAMAAVNAPQEFVSNALWWIAELERRQTTEAHDQAPAMDGNPTSIDQLSDAQYERVVQLNAQLQLRTMDTLSRKWGRHMVHANIALAQKFLDSLPEADQRHFDQYLQDWTHNLNHAETLEFLYGQAIGAGSLPTSGVGVAQEIAQIESVMGTAAYRKDERMQARYRELVTIRDRGR